jgi:hypothetical protein
LIVVLAMAAGLVFLSALLLPARVGGEDDVEAVPSQTTA